MLLIQYNTGPYGQVFVIVRVLPKILPFWEWWPRPISVQNASAIIMLVGTRLMQRASSRGIQNTAAARC